MFSGHDDPDSELPIQRPLISGASGYGAGSLMTWSTVIWVKSLCRAATRGKGRSDFRVVVIREARSRAMGRFPVGTAGKREREEELRARVDARDQAAPHPPPPPP